MATDLPLVVTVPTPELAAALPPMPDGVEVLVWDMRSPAPRPALGIVVPPYMKQATSLQLLRDVPTALVQGQSIGYDTVAATMPPGNVFANASSVHEASTAELAVALTLAAQRGIPGFVLAQQNGGLWSPIFAQSLADRRVLLVGFGGVGKAIAARLVPFEVELTAVATSARVEEGVNVRPVAELQSLLHDAEIVIVSLPLSEATTGIVDGAFLSAMRPGALLVNVGRGTLVDTDALVAHASTGRIRAALDVTDPEPLPDGHPLWSTPGVLIAPHVGGATSAMVPRMARLIHAQAERMVRGEAPLNVVLRT